MCLLEITSNKNDSMSNGSFLFANNLTRSSIANLLMENINQGKYKIVSHGIFCTATEKNCKSVIRNSFEKYVINISNVIPKCRKLVLGGRENLKYHSALCDFKGAHYINTYPVFEVKFLF